MCLFGVRLGIATRTCDDCLVSRRGKSSVHWGRYMLAAGLAGALLFGLADARGARPTSAHATFGSAARLLGASHAHRVRAGAPSLRYETRRGDVFPGLSRAGRPGLAAFPNRTAGPADSEIYRMNADGSGQTNLTNNPGADDNYAAWSYDGTKIAFTQLSFNNFDAEIFVMNPDGSGQMDLSNDPGPRTSTRSGLRTARRSPGLARRRPVTSTSGSCTRTAPTRRS